MCMPPLEATCDGARHPPAFEPPGAPWSLQGLALTSCRKVQDGSDAGLEAALEALLGARTIHWLLIDSPLTHLKLETTNCKLSLQAPVQCHCRTRVRAHPPTHDGLQLT